MSTSQPSGHKIGEQINPASMESSQPPIQNVDAFDVVGERHDGGVDWVVSCSGPLDSSPTTLRLIERKVVAYLVTIAHENFARTYRSTGRAPVRVFISCEHFVSDAARGIIDSLAVRAAKQGVDLLLVKIDVLAIENCDIELTPPRLPLVNGGRGPESSHWCAHLAG